MSSGALPCKFFAAQAQLQAANSDSGQSFPASLSEEKEAAEQGVQELLKEATVIIQRKLQSFAIRQEQRDNSLQRLLSAPQTVAINVAGGSNAAAWSAAEVRQHNAVQLQASLVLSAAFNDSQKARDQLQHCLNREQYLMDSLQGPLQQGLAQSVQLVQHTVNALQREDPQRELPDTEMMLRCVLVTLT